MDQQQLRIMKRRKGVAEFKRLRGMKSNAERSNNSIIMEVANGLEVTSQAVYQWLKAEGLTRGAVV